jgi:hypothetical protein
MFTPAKTLKRCFHELVAHTNFLCNWVQISYTYTGDIRRIPVPKLAFYCL